MSEGGWILLGERPGEEVALGLVGQALAPGDRVGAGRQRGRVPRIRRARVRETVYDLSVRELEPGKTLLSGPMRIETTDEHARRWFRRYWTFGVGSGAHILVGARLNSARRTAEGNESSDA
jgi:hypothetical protein